MNSNFVIKIDMEIKIGLLLSLIMKRLRQMSYFLQSAQNFNRSNRISWGFLLQQSMKQSQLEEGRDKTAARTKHSVSLTGRGQLV